MPPTEKPPGNELSRWVGSRIGEGSRSGRLLASLMLLLGICGPVINGIANIKRYKEKSTAPQNPHDLEQMVGSTTIYNALALGVLRSH
jgi:hypothetical protein